MTEQGEVGILFCSRSLSRKSATAVYEMTVNMINVLCWIIYYSIYILLYTLLKYTFRIRNVVKICLCNQKKALFELFLYNYKYILRMREKATDIFALIDNLYYITTPLEKISLEVWTLDPVLLKWSDYYLFPIINRLSSIRVYFLLLMSTFTTERICTALVLYNENIRKYVTFGFCFNDRWKVFEKGEKMFSIFWYTCYIYTYSFIAIFINLLVQNTRSTIFHKL